MQATIHKGALKAALERSHLIGDIIQHYGKIAKGAPSIAFCQNLAFAHNLAEKFRSKGFSSAVIEGATTRHERRKMTADLGSGNLNVMLSCNVVSEGYDVPDVRYVIFGDPTQSLTRFLQEAGRVMRPSKGKEFGGIIDHTPNTDIHGWPDDDRVWDLTEGAKRSENAEPIATRRCPECYAVRRPAPVCTNCGYIFTVQEARMISVRKGTLKEIRREDREREREKKARAEAIKQARQEAKAAIINTPSDCRSLEDFQILAKKKGYKPGWAYHQFQNKNRRAA